MQIRWTAPAAAALESVIDFVARENQQAAFEVAQRIRIAVAQLSEHPKLGRVGRVRGTYELVIFGIPYVVPYRIKGPEVQMLNIYHTSRRWPETFG